MKKMIVWALALMLIFTEVLFPIQMNAEETKNQCEVMAFTVEAPIAGDEKLVGGGEPGQEIELLFNDLEEIIEVEDDGSFQYEWKEQIPKLDEIITLKNGPYELEMVVKGETTEIEPIEAELERVCKEDVDSEDEKPVEEEIEAEEQTDVDEEQAEDVTEKTDEIIEEESEKEFTEVDNETREEPSVEEETNGEEPANIDENKSEETTGDTDEVVEEIREKDSEESTAVDEEAAEENPVEEEVEEHSEEKEAEAEEIIDEESKIEGTEEDLSGEKHTADEADKEEELIEEVENEAESDEEDSTVEKDEKKLEDDEMENSKKNTDDKNEEAEKKKMLSVDVDKDEEREAKKHSSPESVNSASGRSGQVTTQTAENISTQIEDSIQPIQNKTEHISSASEFKGALEAEDIEKILLESDINIVTNRSNSVIDINSSSRQKIIEANGHTINLDESILKINNGRTIFGVPSLFQTNVENVIFKDANLLTTNSNQNEGFFKKETDLVNLRFSNITFNKAENGNTLEGMFGSSWESHVHFYGNNEIYTNNTHYGMSFRKVIVHEGAVLDFIHKGNGAALKYDRNIFAGDGYGLEVNEKAEVLIRSDESVFETNLRVLFPNRRTVDNIIRKDAHVVFSGGGDNLFNLDTLIDFDIREPKLVKFNNEKSNGTLFSNTARFDVKEVTKKEWLKGNMNENQPDLSNEIQQDTFTLDSNSNIRRLDLEQPIYELEPFNLENIYDTHTSITGKTLPGATIIIYDSNGTELARMESNNEGIFSFELKEYEKLSSKVKADEVLTLKAELDNAHTETEMTVQGNRLEFSQAPPDIIFETTEIKDEETVIHRENDTYSMEIEHTDKDESWKLEAEVENPLSAEGHAIEDTLYYFNGDNEEQSLESGSVRIAEQNKNDDSTLQNVEWGRDEGILLKMNPIRAAADKEYSATINWTLSNGP